MSNSTPTRKSRFVGAVVVLPEAPGAEQASDISRRIREDHFPTTAVSYTISDSLPENLSDASVESLTFARAGLPASVYLIVRPSDSVTYPTQIIL